MIEIGNFVVACNPIDEIEADSVGLVVAKDLLSVEVFFIGRKTNKQVTPDSIRFLDVTQTGKPYPVKICNICHILKSEDSFEVNQTDAKGRKTTRPSCRDCRVHIDGERLKPEESRRLDKIKPQGVFTCPICQKTSIAWITANFVKDHDHETGLAREWICDSCNTGLGRFKDDIRLIERVLDYLRAYKAKHQRDSSN